jgi:hypothetical protein
VPLRNKVVFLVDVSGSMNVAPLYTAIQLVQETCENPTDDLEVAIYAFSDATHRWPGMPETPGWGKLPSVETLKEIKKFFANYRRGAGDTRVAASIAAALELEGEISIVLITDGIFDQESFLEMVDAYQEKRKTPANILILQVGSPSMVTLPNGVTIPWNSEHLRKVADKYGGGMYRVE